MARAARVPKGVDKRRKRLADGTTRTYWFYRPLGMVAGRLPGEPGDAVFHAEYALKLETWLLRNAPDPNARALGSLITLYQASRAFTDLSPKSRADYSKALHVIRLKFGATTPLKGVMDHQRMQTHIESWHQSMAATPRMADYNLAVLHRLLEFGRGKGRLDHNRAVGIKRLYVANRARHVWTRDQIEAFCGAAGNQVGWVVRLAYVTGQRQGDLLALTWSDVKDDGVTFRTSKTGVRIVVPMYDELRAALAPIRRCSVHVLTSASGQPWQVDTFRHTFSKAQRTTGVGEGLHFHDLRGSALKAFADAGCSELELRAISGHSMKSMSGALSSYIDAFRSLAESAVRKREDAYRTELQTKAANQRSSADS